MLEISLVILGVLTAELLTSFVLFPLRFGENYYRHRKHTPYQYHPVIGYIHKPQLRYSNPTRPPEDAPRKITFVDVRTNHNGFLTSIDLEALPKDQKLIFCMGGSTTAGLESHHGNTYPAILDSLMEPKGYRCINAGVGGHRSIHELLLLKEKVLRYDPSAVIIFSGFNDFEAHCYRVSRPYDPFRHYFSSQFPKTLMGKVSGFSGLFYLLETKYLRRLSQKRGSSGPFADFLANAKEALKENRWWLEEWRANIGELVELCEDRKVKCYLISHITPMYLNASSEAKEYANHDLGLKGAFDVFTEFHHLLRQESKDLCRTKEVTFLDIASDFEDLCAQYSGDHYHKHRFSWFSDRAHLTEKGNELLATYISKALMEAL